MREYKRTRHRGYGGFTFFGFSLAEFLLYLSLICVCWKTSQQQEINATSKESESLSIEQQQPDYRNESRSLSSSTDSHDGNNDIANARNVETAGNDNTEEVVDEYEYEYETEPEEGDEQIEEPKDRRVGRQRDEIGKTLVITNRTSDDAKSAIGYTIQDENDNEDPSSSQYDAYYYYDDYDNSSLPRETTDDVVDYIEDEQQTTSNVTEVTEVTEKIELVDKNTTETKEKNDAVSKVAALMDSSEHVSSVVRRPLESNDFLDSSILIGEAVVSVVTTKSVVNNTVFLPEVTPATTDHVLSTPSTEIVTEENPTSRIKSSAQTSRSVSGARFLAFPVIDGVDEIERNNAAGTSLVTDGPTESIIDKLDRVQSDLSSGLLVSNFRNANKQFSVEERTTRRPFTPGKFIPKRYNDRRQESNNNNTRVKADNDLQHDQPSSENFTSKPHFNDFRTSTTPKTSTAAPQIASKNKTSIFVQDVSAFLPAGYKLRKSDTKDSEKNLLSDILSRSKVNIQSLLPADYDKRAKKNATVTTSTERAATTTTTTKTTSTTVSSNTEKPNVEKSLQSLFEKSQLDISALLPRDYNQKKFGNSATTKTTTAKVETSMELVVTSTSTTPRPGGLKIVFPSRPGGRKPIHKLTTERSSRVDAPAAAVTPRIQKGWPTRATTEFTGWPTSSTTPISIEKLLEAARTATVAATNSSFVTTTDSASSVSTTTTTTTTIRPTTPGICENECEVAGTIRIINNTMWQPELLDRNTREWQQLASTLETEMNLVFLNSPVLRKWYQKIRIDSFSQGSILVDYFVSLSSLTQNVNTQELKVIFHDSLRTYNAHEWNQTRIKGVIRLGPFMIDPKSTDFVVIPKTSTPNPVMEEDRWVPQWVIAVIVVGVGGLVFIVIFGVSVLINRRNKSKLKPNLVNIPDENIPKNIMNSTTSIQRSAEYVKSVSPIWNMPDSSWNDKSFESASQEVLVSRQFQDNKKYNIYDSWRSEWNGYYYNPSHSSSKFDPYDTAKNSTSFHRPDYDTNF